MRRLSKWSCCAFLLFGLAHCQRESRPAATTDRFPNASVIVISIDTLRADHLPAYGYADVSTPNLDALRADSVLFRNAWSHCPLTLPSHTTLMTGELPFENGVRDNIGYALQNHGPTLPELFKSAGYETGAAVSAYVLRGESGLGRLFDFYDDQIAFQPGIAAGAIQRPGAQTIDSALKWIHPRRQRPFFFFLHLFEPHTPYEAPEPFRSSVTSPYDAEIAYVDSLVGRFVAELKRDGIYDRAIVVLLSDHGEGLGDHGEREHGIFLYREALHVPLMVKLPRSVAAGESEAQPAGLIDVAPTLVRLTGLKPPPSWHGQALFGADAPVPHRQIYGESVYGRVHLGWSELRSLADDQYQFIEAPRPELYDLVRDQAEKQNLVNGERRVYSRLRDSLAKYPRELHAPSAASAEEMKKLAALGYLTGTATSGGPLIDPKDGIADLSLYEKAMAFASERNFDAAIEAYRSLVTRNPRFSDARTQLAAAYEATGRFAEAEHEYRGVLQQNPAAAEQVALALAAVYLNLGRFDQAVAYAKLAMEANRGGAELLLGRVALARRDYASAGLHAGAAMADAHFHAAAVLLLSEALVAQHHLDRALEVLDVERNGRTARGQPPLRSLQLARGDALMRLHRTSEGEEAFRDEIRLFPDDRDAYTSLATAYALAGRTAEIEPLVQAMVVASPDRSTYALAVKTLETFGLASRAEEWKRRGGAVMR